MIKIYTDNRKSSGSVDGFFNYSTTTDNIDEECKMYMEKIDRARLVDENTESVLTPHGVCSMNRLSTGVKAILVLHTIINKKMDASMNIDECDKDIVSILFDIAERQSDFEVTFVIHWGNVNENDRHIFLLNDKIVCNGGAELLKHIDKKYNVINKNMHMEKLIYDRINVSNCQKSAVFNLELKDRYTMISGKTSSGKTLMWRILKEISLCSRSYASLGMEVLYDWDKVCFFKYGDTFLVPILKEAVGKLVILDNFDHLVNRVSELADVIVNDDRNQYLILGRNYKAIGLDRKYTGELVNDNGIIRLAYND